MVEGTFVVEASSGIFSIVFAVDVVCGGTVDASVLLSEVLMSTLGLTVVYLQLFT